MTKVVSPLFFFAGYILLFAAGAAVLFLLWSLTIRNAAPKDTVIQEY